MNFNSCRCKSNKIPENFQSTDESSQKTFNTSLNSQGASGNISKKVSYETGENNNQEITTTNLEEEKSTKPSLTFSSEPPNVKNCSSFKQGNETNSGGQKCCVCGTNTAAASDEPDCGCNISKKDKKKKKSKDNAEKCCVCDEPSSDKKKKPEKKMCGGKKKKPCVCGDEKHEKPPLPKRIHADDQCILEFSVMEKHAGKCLSKKPRPKDKDDRVGSYDVIGRVVYPGCIINCNFKPASKGPKCPGKVNGGNGGRGAATTVMTSDIPCTPSTSPMNKCTSCGMEGPLCKNPTCEWATMIHQAKCPYADPKTKTVCENCASIVMKGRQLCAVPTCQKGPSSSNLTMRVNVEDEYMKMERKRMHIMKLRKIIKETEPAVTASKSNKSFRSVHLYNSQTSLDDD